MHPTFLAPLAIPKLRSLPIARSARRDRVFKMCETTNTSPNASLWQALQYPIITSATLSPTHREPTITAHYTQRDPITCTKRTITRVYHPCEPFYNATPALVAPPSHPLHDGTRAVFTNHENGVYLELWDDDRLKSVAKLPHGPVYADEWFSGVRLSDDCSKLAYIAERKESDVHGEREWRERLVRQYDVTAGDPLGEGYKEKRAPALYVYDIENGTAKEVNTGEGCLHPGQPVWHGNDLAITLRPGDVDTMTRFDHANVHDLGVRYCYNRPAEVVLLALGEEGTTKRLSKGEVCCFAPRIRGDVLVYLATMPRGDGMVQPHNEAKVLRMVHLGDEECEPVSLVDVPRDPAGEDFPGLYAHGLVESPWVEENMLVVASVWGSISRLLGVVVPSGEGESSVVDLVREADDLFADTGLAWVKEASVTLLDVCDGYVLIGASDPATPIQLFLLHIDGMRIKKVTPMQGKSDTVEELNQHLRERSTYDLMAIRSHLRESFTELAREYETGVDAPAERFQVTVLRPGKEDKNHLIVYPHGGPHTSTLNGYATSTMALLHKGYTVMYVNYRGSLGLGEKSLQSLPGNIGTQDVNEVVQATRWALMTYSLPGASFVGGSHSGFLGAHTSLIPGLFRGTVLRNPVVDIASMQGGTDIPDWCFCEAGIPATPGYIADAEMLKKMYSVSPVAFVNECDEIGKTLLQLGKADRRVPVGQGLLWRRILNGRFGDVCEVRFYPFSGHAIDDIPEGDDAWVAALDFLDATVTSPPIECLHSAHRKA